MYVFLSDSMLFSRMQYDGSFAANVTTEAERCSNFKGSSLGVTTSPRSQKRNSQTWQAMRAISASGLASKQSVTASLHLQDVECAKVCCKRPVRSLDGYAGRIRGAIHVRCG